MWKNWNLHTLLGRMYNGTVTVETSLTVPDMEYEPTTSLLDKNLEKRKTVIKKNMHFNLHCRTIYNNQDMKAT